ncbi:uncharacterized protein [Narcine bancroftii]|uniref:uncharacterized protein n=1 Tax=Narcine bancroftii TaxID=1343680 RepID=UPI003831AD48
MVGLDWVDELPWVPFGSLKKKTGTSLAELVYDALADGSKRVCANGPWRRGDTRGRGHKIPREVEVVQTLEVAALRTEDFNSRLPQASTWSAHLAAVALDQAGEKTSLLRAPSTHVSTVGLIVDRTKTARPKTNIARGVARKATSPRYASQSQPAAQWPSTTSPPPPPPQSPPRAIAGQPAVTSGLPSHGGPNSLLASNDHRLHVICPDQPSLSLAPPPKDYSDVMSGLRNDVTSAGRDDVALPDSQWCDITTPGTPSAAGKEGQPCLTLLCGVTILGRAGVDAANTEALPSLQR